MTKLESFKKFVEKFNPEVIRVDATFPYQHSEEKAYQVTFKGITGKIMKKLSMLKFLTDKNILDKKKWQELFHRNMELRRKNEKGNWKEIKGI